jgi:lipoprotein Spr
MVCSCLFCSCAVKFSSDPAENARLKEVARKYKKNFGLKVRKSNIRLYDEIDQWWGAPYKFGGTTKKGTDCSNFVRTLYKNVYRKEIPRSSNEQFKKSKPVKRKKLKEGHLVFFDIENKQKPTHVGIFLKNGKFVHASTSKGIRIDDMDMTYYDDSFIKGGEFP